MHILIAPNAFKHSLTAQEAAEAIRKGLNLSELHCTTECFPIADGGDGTAELLIQKRKGTLVPVAVKDPIGRIIHSSYGLIDNGQTAIIEMADASGIRLLKSDELNPLKANTYGTGEMILNALDRGVSRIIIGMGGSATIDGSTGILRALGVRLLDEQGKTLPYAPESLVSLRAIDLSGMDQRILQSEIIILCDVNNTLLGKEGAVAVFGPQKGADHIASEKLEASLSVWNEVTRRETGIDMAAIKRGGTAGGAAAGLCAHLNAKLVNGADFFLQLTDFESSLQRSDLVITGEGSIDEQTLQGKGPFIVAESAQHHSIPVIGLAGRLPLESDSDLNKYFEVLMAIGHAPADLSTALKDTYTNLTRVSKQIGNLLAQRERYVSK